MRILLLMLLAASTLFSQTQPKENGQTAPEQKSAKSVTVTGCVSQGIECLRLTAPNDPSKLLYSIAKTDKLQIGHAYRITGTVGEVGFCQEGKPILTPTKITEVRLKCSAKIEGKSKK
jgi:hypothetical protein